MPLWIRKVLLRGLAPAPDQRFPSMRALIAALSDDPEVVRRRWLRRAGMVLALAGLGAGYHELVQHRAKLCRGGSDQITQIWNQPRRQAMRSAFAKTGLPYASTVFDTVAARVDDYAEGWVSEHRAACEATRVRHTQSDELLDLRMACLDRHLRSFGSQVEALSSAPPQLVQNAVSLVESLPAASECADLAGLRAVVRPPSDRRVWARIEQITQSLARANALHRAGQLRQGLTLAREQVATARALGYRPLEASAHRQLASILEMSGDLVSSAQATREAARAAIASGMEREGGALLGEYGYLMAASTGRLAEGHQFVADAFVFLDRAGTGPSFERAMILNAVANLDSESQGESALAHFQEAARLCEQLRGPSSLKCAEWRANIGMQLDLLRRHREAIPQLRQAIRVMTRLLGNDHPEPALAYLTLGRALAHDHQLKEAELMIDRAERLSSVVGNPGLRVRILRARALLHGERGQPGKAYQALELALSGSDDQDQIEVLREMAECALVLHQPARAIATLEEGMARARRVQAPAWAIAQFEFWMARALSMRDQRATQALPWAERALRTLVADPHSDLAAAIRSWITSHRG